MAQSRSVVEPPRVVCAGFLGSREDCAESHEKLLDIVDVSERVGAELPRIVIAQALEFREAVILLPLSKYVRRLQPEEALDIDAFEITGNREMVHIAAERRAADDVVTETHLVQGGGHCRAQADNSRVFDLIGRTLWRLLTAITCRKE